MVELHSVVGERRRTNVELSGEPSVNCSTSDLKTTGVPGVLGLQSTGVPSLQSSGVPRLQSTGVPSLQTTGVPSLQSTGVPRLQSSGVPSLQSTGVPSLQSTRVPHLQSNGVPRLQTTGVPGVPGLQTTTGDPRLQTTGVPGDPGDPGLQTTGVPGLQTTTGDPGLQTTGVPGDPGLQTTAGDPGLQTIKVSGLQTTGVPVLGCSPSPIDSPADQPSVNSSTVGLQPSSAQRRRPVQHNAIRPCMYCGKMQTNLNRHLLSRHKSEALVTAAANAPDKLTRHDLFKKMRKTGIFKHKKLLSGGGGQEVLQRERRWSGKKKASTVFCSTCHGFYSSNYFFLHSKSCADCAENRLKPTGNELLDSTKYQVSEDFKAEILSKFRDNEIGDICRGDPAILQFGSRLFDDMQRKRDRKSEVRWAVMSDMRRAAHLFVRFNAECQVAEPPVCCDSSADMFHRSNFHLLQTAIEAYTREDGDGVKAGLKNAIHYLILRMSKVLKAFYLVQGNDQSAAEVDEFLEVLALHRNDVFGDVCYNLCRNQQGEPRRSEQLPSEDDVLQLQSYNHLGM